MIERIAIGAETALPTNTNSQEHQGSGLSRMDGDIIGHIRLLPLCILLEVPANDVPQGMEKDLMKPPSPSL